MTDVVWDSPAVVTWAPDMTTGRAIGDQQQEKRFATTTAAVRFVMEELKPDPRMNVGVYPERGSALVGLASIEQAYRSGPHAGESEPGGVA